MSECKKCKGSGTVLLEPGFFGGNSKPCDCQIGRSAAITGSGAVNILNMASDNMRKDPQYAPYCMRCRGLVRMRRVSLTVAKCKCGAVHEIKNEEIND